MPVVRSSTGATASVTAIFSDRSATSLRTSPSRSHRSRTTSRFEPRERAVLTVGRDELLHRVRLLLVRGDEHLLEQRDDTALGVRVEGVAEQLVELGAVRGQRVRQRAVLLVEQRLGRVGDPGDRGFDLLVEPVGHRVEPLLDDVRLDAHVRREHRPRADAEALAGGVARVSVHPDGLAHDPEHLGVGLDELVHDE